ncbi:hypothetical protein TNCV_384281 [Trichonephila clavipes]|nr:hypothetical protein TNCV_384281 [Trichonephila clavipes]
MATSSFMSHNYSSSQSEVPRDHYNGAQRGALRLALQDEWAAMPQQLIDTLILSMGRRCETCLAVRGDHIPY